MSDLSVGFGSEVSTVAVGTVVTAAVVSARRCGQEIDVFRGTCGAGCL